MISGATFLPKSPLAIFIQVVLNLLTYLSCYKHSQVTCVINMLIMSIKSILRLSRHLKRNMNILLTFSKYTVRFCTPNYVQRAKSFPVKLYSGIELLTADIKIKSQAITNMSITIICPFNK